MRVVVLAALVVGHLAWADGATTGADGTPAPSAGVLHFGGDTPRFVLFLRTDGPLGEAGHVALGTALAALARVPGAGVDLFLDPSDREAGALAEALLSLPDEAARRALLFALSDQDLPRWSDAMSISRIGRRAGLVLPPRLGRSALSPSARALLRRPPGVAFADRSFVAFGGRSLSLADLDAIAEADVVPSPSPPLRETRVLAAGDPLAPYVVALRFALPLSIVGRDGLRVALDAHDHARARLRLELAPPSEDAHVSEGEVVLRRAFARADATQRVMLAHELVRGELPQSAAVAVWLVQSAGLDPEPLLAGRSDEPLPRADGVPSLSVAVDGASSSYAGDARLRGRLPSLRERLERSSR